MKKSGEQYNETIEEDTEKQTEMFKVPAHGNVDHSKILHDFKKVSLVTSKKAQIRVIRASSYEPHNLAGAGWLGYRDGFRGVFIWEISARPTEVNSRNTTKMVEHKLVLFATVTALWSLVTLLIKLIRILLKRKYIQDQNYAILAYML